MLKVNLKYNKRYQISEYGTSGGSMKYLFISLLILAPLRASALAEDIYASLGIGRVGATHTDSETTSTSSLSQFSSDQDDEGSDFVEIEFGIMDQLQSLSLVLSGFTYEYADKSPSDEMKQLLVSYRRELLPHIEKTKLWLGFGAGLSMLEIGETTLDSGGVRATLQDSSKNTLLLQARIGTDFRLNENFFVGINLSYNYTAVDVVIDLTEISSGDSRGQLLTEFTRTWIAGHLSIGYIF